MQTKMTLSTLAVAAISMEGLCNTQRPDIVVILVDDLGYSDLGCYGGEARTPHIDALAQNGIRFRGFYNTARCSPTRAAILTGLYYHQVAEDPAHPLSHLRGDNNVTMAELLRDQGYRTYMAGKWHLGTNPVEKRPWNRGFQHIFGFGATGAANAADYWDPRDYRLTSENNEIPAREYGLDPYDFYQTDALADYVIDFIDHHIGKEDDAPFFLYLTPYAPHWHLAAPRETAEYTPPGGMSYLDIYAQGWDVVRQQRYDRMRAEGMIDARYVLPPFGDAPHIGEYLTPPRWDTLDSDRQADLARRMAIYTAMVDHLDGMVGRIVDHLRDTGRLDNTLILFLSDNGANAEGTIFGSSAYGRNPLTGARLLNMGQPFEDDRLRLGGGWANVSNTPFRLYKKFNHEGGIRTPLVVHWPEGIDNPGRWSDQAGHVIDVMATVLDITGVEYPAEYSGRTVLPMEGESLLPAFQNEPPFDRKLGFEHDTNRGWIDGRWKLATKHFTASDGSTLSDTLELYDMDTDPTEMNNLALSDPEKLMEMVQAWNAWASRVGVSPDLLLPLPGVERPASDPTDLFLDTFNRNDTEAIGSGTDGISGSVLSSASFPPVYFEPDGAAAGGTRVFSGFLEMASGVPLSEVAVRHNFTDAAILSQGGFTVEMDIRALQGGSGSYTGFGVGLSHDEATGEAGTSIGRFTVSQAWLIDEVEAGDGWILGGGQGSFDVQSGIVPTAGESYFNFSINPGPGPVLNNRALVKEFPVILRAGESYTVEGDFNVGRADRPFIADPFSGPVSDQIAFGFFDPSGIDFGLANNGERLKIRDAIHAVLLDADNAGTLSWENRSLPEEGGANWQTWRYTLTVPDDSPFDGRPVWFGVYGGHTEPESVQRSMAFDRLQIRMDEESNSEGVDFFVELDGGGHVNVWSRGEQLDAVPVGTTEGRLTAAFALESFEKGAPVRAAVYFNGRRLDIRSDDPSDRDRLFQWRQSGSNYIGVSAHSPGTVEIDNLAIRTFPIGRTLAGGYARRFGLSGEEAHPDADPDGDGRTNLQEWLMGSNPAEADRDVSAIHLLAVSQQDGMVRFAARERADVSGEGIAVHASVDLNEWTEVSPETVRRKPLAEAPGYEEVEMELPFGDLWRERLFLRIRYLNDEVKPAP